MTPSYRLALIAAALVCIAAPARAADKVLSLTAHALSLDTPGKSRTATVLISFERWSTEEERKSLLDTIVEKDTDRLADLLRDLPKVGVIRTTRSLGWDIHYAHMETTASGGTRIVFATDRPMNFLEASNAGRSLDYDVMVSEIRLGPDGKGDGRLVPAARVTYDRETRAIEIEDFSNQPVRLTYVTRDKK